MNLKGFRYCRTHTLPNGETEELEVYVDLNGRDVADVCFRTMKRWVDKQLGIVGEEVELVDDGGVCHAEARKETGTVATTGERFERSPAGTEPGGVVDGFLSSAG